MTERKPMG